MSSYKDAVLWLWRVHNIVNIRLYHTYYYEPSSISNIEHDFLNEGMFVWPSIQECPSCRLFTASQKENCDAWLAGTDPTTKNKNKHKNNNENIISGKKKPNHTKKDRQTDSSFSRFEAWAPPGDVIWQEDEVFTYLQRVYWDRRWPMKVESTGKEGSGSSIHLQAAAHKSSSSSSSFLHWVFVLFHPSTPFGLMILYLFIIMIGYVIVRGVMGVLSHHKKYKRKI